MYNVTESQKKLSAIQQGQSRMMNEASSSTKIEDEDEAWALAFEQSMKQEMIESEYETPIESPPPR